MNDLHNPKNKFQSMNNFVIFLNTMLDLQNHQNNFQINNFVKILLHYD